MKVIARRGDDYLLALPNGRARVFDAEENSLGVAFNKESILARGYWAPFDDPDGSVLTRARAIGDTSP